MQIQNSLQNSNLSYKTNFKSVYPVYHWHKIGKSYAPAFDMNLIRRYQNILTRMLNSRVAGGRKQNPTTFLQEIVKYISEKDIDYKNIPYVRTFFNYKGGIKEAWNGNAIIEPMAYILTGRDAVDFENMYGKPVGTAQKISKQYDDERIGKLEIEQAKSAYGFGGRAYIKDSLGKFKDLITGRPLELHTIFIDGKQKKPPILLKLAFFQKDGFDNPLVTNGII